MGSSWRWIWTVLLLAAWLLAVCDASLFCGESDCYALLEVKRTDPIETIKKSYRQLSRALHPDKTRGDKELEQRFIQVAQAYEILKDEEMRKEYDYFLDHPTDPRFMQYARYYRARIQATVDIRLVFGALVLLISFVQYSSQQLSYGQWLRAVKQHPDLQKRAKEMQKEQEEEEKEKEKDQSKGEAKKDKKKEKEKKAASQSELPSDEIFKKLMLHEGIGNPPNINRILLLQLVYLPKNMPLYTIRWVRIWSCYFRNQPYTRPDQEYLTARKLGFISDRWEGLPEEKRNELVSLQLWIDANHKAWKKQEEEFVRSQYVGTAKYKQYKRYMKKNS